MSDSESSAEGSATNSNYVSDAEAEESGEPPLKRPRVSSDEEEEEDDEVPLPELVKEEVKPQEVEEEAKPELSAATQTFINVLSKGNVGPEKKYGLGKIRFLSDPDTGNQIVQFPPVLVGPKPAMLAGVGGLVGENAKAPSYTLEVTIRPGEAPAYVASAYPSLALESKALVDAFLANGPDVLMRRLWANPTDDLPKARFIDAASKEFSKTYPHFPHAYCLRPEDEIVLIVMAKDQSKTEDQVIDMIRSSGYTSPSAKRPNDNAKNLAYLVNIMEETNTADREEWIENKAFEEWVNDKLYPLGKMTKTDGGAEAFVISLKAPSTCNKTDFNGDPVKVTPKTHPEVARVVDLYGLQSKVVFNKPIIRFGNGEFLKVDGQPFHEATRIHGEMDPKMLQVEPLEIGDAVSISGKLGLVETQFGVYFKFIPDMESIILLRRPKTQQEIAQALGANPAFEGFGDPFSYP